MALVELPKYPVPWVSPKGVRISAAKASWKTLTAALVLGPKNVVSWFVAPAPVVETE